MSQALQRAEARIAKKEAKAAKVAKMAEMYRQGLTLEDIGRQYGCTREYVRQLLRAAGVTAQEGGHSVRAKAVGAVSISKARQLQAKQEARFGVPYDLLRVLRSNGATRAFGRQRANANWRGVEWRLTLGQWWAVWQASGKFHMRGVGVGKYCMSRIRDDGAYALGNVHVQLCTENSREAVSKWAGKTKPIKGVFCLYPGRDLAWQAKVGDVSLGYFSSAEAAGAARDEYMAKHGIKPAGLGSGRGWTYRKDKKTGRPYVVQVAGTKPTSHATQEEAEAEYRRRVAEVMAKRAAAEA